MKSEHSETPLKRKSDKWLRGKSILYNLAEQRTQGKLTL